MNPLSQKKRPPVWYPPWNARLCRPNRVRVCLTHQPPTFSRRILTSRGCYRPVEWLEMRRTPFQRGIHLTDLAPNRSWLCHLGRIWGGREREDEERQGLGCCLAIPHGSADRKRGLGDEGTPSNEIELLLMLDLFYRILCEEKVSTPHTSPTAMKCKKCRQKHPVPLDQCLFRQHRPSSL